MRRIACALFLALGGVLLTACPQSTPPTTPTLTVSPTTATVTEGGTQAFTATLQNSSDTISWALNPAVGSITPATGASTTYAAPASVASSTTVTLTATAGSLTASATMTVNPTPGPGTITVTGRVVKFTGSQTSVTPAPGVEVQINDSAGLTITTLGGGLEPQVATDSQGYFTLTGVTPPYTLSVIPPTGVLDDLPQTWEGVTRSDPTVVITPLTGTGTVCPSVANGVLTATLNTVVATGHYGQFLYVAPDIDHRQLLSFVSATIAAGNSTVSLAVPFTIPPCVTQVSGKLIYLERELSTGVIVQTGTVDATVTTGNTTFVDITVDSPNTSGITGQVSFPVGTVNGVAYLVYKVGDASGYIEAQAVSTADPTFDISAPVLPGVEYRILVLSSSFPVGDKLQYVYSDVVTPGTTGVNLDLPSLGGTTVPAGTGNDVTPEFVYKQVSGTNLNYVYFDDTPYTGNVLWLGATTNDRITLPQLPQPARLTAGTQANPNDYLWANINSVNVRAGGGADTMLDGRQQLVRHFYLDAIFNPDDISAGSLNLEPTLFSIAP